jgi:hypothetical protein
MRWQRLLRRRSCRSGSRRRTDPSPQGSASENARGSLQDCPKSDAAGHGQRQPDYRAVIAFERPGTIARMECGGPCRGWHEAVKAKGQPKGLFPLGPAWSANPGADGAVWLPAQKKLIAIRQGRSQQPIACRPPRPCHIAPMWQGHMIARRQVLSACHSSLAESI